MCLQSFKTPGARLIKAVADRRELPKGPLKISLAGRGRSKKIRRRVVAEKGGKVVSASAQSSQRLTKERKLPRRVNMSVNRSRPKEDKKKDQRQNTNSPKEQLQTNCR